MLQQKKRLFGVLSAVLLCAISSSAYAADEVTMNSGDTAWMLTSMVLVLFMTIPGLALFYGGLVRTKNVISVLMQCFAITAMVTILWLFYGYSMAFDTNGSAFIGSFGKAMFNGIGQDTLSGTIPETVFSMFQLTFAIITPALIIGAFAERMKFSAMLIFMALWVTVVYFPIAHMLWSGPSGLLAAWGVKDFAGGMVVHMNAGFAALVSVYVIGPRKGYGKVAMPAHNITMVCIGACMLWVGWFGFNAGSALAANGLAGMAMANTHIATAVAAFIWMILDWVKKGKPTMVGMATGAVAGLVAITPAAGFVNPMGSVWIGLAAGIGGFWGCNNLKAMLGYDDSLDVFGIHGICGFIGTVLTGVFAVDGGGAAMAMTQLKGAIFTAAYTSVSALAILLVVKATIGLRPSESEEEKGLDLVLHGEKGYEF